MAIAKLPVNFKDDIIDTTVNTKRRYRMEENSDGTTSLEDVTTYEQTGSYFGATQINQMNGAVNELIDALENVEENVVNFGGKDFILINQETLQFSNNVAVIQDKRITESSLADVYFTQDTFNTAESAVITVETFAGNVKLTAGRTPENVIRATIHIRVV